MGNTQQSLNQTGSLRKEEPHVQFDFREMIQFKKKCIEQDYTLKQVMGKGKNTIIYKGVMKNSKLYRTIKVIEKAQKQDLLSSSVVNQVCILKNLDHPNVAKFIDVYESPQKYYIVSELLTGEKLFDRIIQKEYLSQTDICIYFYDILQIIRYLHSKKVMHRGIKPDNLIFSDTGENACLKIIDFGSACEFQDSSPQERERIGSAHYIAPEVISKRYNEKCDIWSAGVILFIMLSGEPPFNGRDDSEIMVKISQGIYKFGKPKWRNISDNSKDLVSKLLSYNPEMRPSAQEAMNHPWFELRKQRTGKESNLRDTLSNMKMFHSLKKMQQGVLVFMVNFLSSNHERDALMKVFRMIDLDGDGKISLQELKQGYQKTQGLDLHKAEKIAKKIFDQVDKNRSGYIDYSEFLMSTINVETSLTDAKLESAFKMLDQDGDGTLSVQELKSVLGPNIPTEVYGLIVKEFDQNKNGSISKQQFIAMMKSISFKLE